MNYYNEYDPKAAAWLRQLIKQGLIPDGIVDEQSIEDIVPNKLAGFTQCHFFAGIGGWSLALRLAGWPEDRPVWTGSCPCQPFSTAGKGAGFADERHLWPAFHHLISQCRPPVVFGEQVASKDGLTWLDLVHADCEASGYAFGATDLCAAGVFAPHPRQRLWWVADSDSQRRCEREPGIKDAADAPVAGETSRMVNNIDQRLAGWADRPSSEIRREEQARPVTKAGESCRLADADGSGPQSGGTSAAPTGHRDPAVTDGRDERLADSDSNRPEMEDKLCRGIGSQKSQRQANDSGSHSASGRTSTPDSFWRNPDWLHCRDGKWRCVESGTFPLAHGIPARVVRLRGYGNAIVPQVASEFIKAYLETK